MSAKIEVLKNPAFPDVPVEVTIESRFTGSTVALLTLRHDELADLYLALTDYYAEEN